MKAEFFLEVMFALGKTNFDTVMLINIIGSKTFVISIIYFSIKLHAFHACRRLY